MLKKIFSTVLTTIFCSIAMQTIYAQGIGINETGAAPDSSAILDASSTDKGLLGPRMTTAQRDNISSPAIGLQIFNLDTDCVEVFFANGGWLPIRCGCSSFPDATFSNPGGAANVPVNFDANTVVSTNTYNWIFDQGTPSSSADTSEIVTWTTADTYEVTLIVSDENNCVSTHTENVVIVPCASFPDSTFTGSNNGSINSPIAFSANGSGAGYTYDWTFPSGSPSASTQQNPTVEWATDGTYIVELTVTDNLSCSATDTMEVTIDLCAPDGPWNFTNASATGRFGPSQSQINTAYSGTNLDGDVTINTQGIQEWTVPSTGIYRMTAAGAQGGPYTSSDGEGAIIQADITLTAGQSIKILVGQHGLGSSSYPLGFSGGGGSFVTFSNNTPILVAGGGGSTFSSSGTLQQLRGQTTMLGATAGVTPNSVSNGGNTSNNSGAGGGLNTDGAGAGDAGGNSFINGGTGGYSTQHTFIEGGFGGGGVRSGSFGEGCGGGYSGGNGGTTTSSWQGGAGGGSFIISTAENIYTSNGQFESSTTFNGGSIQNLNQYNSNNGYVTIEKVCP